MRQNYPLTMAVFDYRTAVAARDTFNMKDRKRAFEVLSENPQLLQMLSKMHRAQLGQPLAVSEKRAQREGMEIATAHRKEPEGESGET